jgi:acyl dehydratase
MTVPLRHVLAQGPVVGALVRALGASAVRRVTGRRGRSARPGPTIRATVGPRDPRLVRDHVRQLGGDPSWYGDDLPAHLYPQWGFPLLARTLSGVPWDLTRILNAGVRLKMEAPLAADEPLDLTARLADVDDDGRRVLLTERLVTTTGGREHGLVTEVTAIVPLATRDGGKKKERPRVPSEAREMDRWELSPRAGLDFALTTGDFNPIHWSSAYARMFGFEAKILHGFAVMARAMESIHGKLLSGRVRDLATFEARFVRPLVLPASPGVYTHGDEIYVGDAPDAPACMTGRFTPRPPPASLRCRPHQNPSP